MRTERLMGHLKDETDIYLKRSTVISEHSPATPIQSHATPTRAFGIQKTDEYLKVEITSVKN